MPAYVDEDIRAIRQHIDELISKGANIDAEYYCLHHPQAKVPNREVWTGKPKPGLIIKAAGELDIELKVSWMVGDGLTDIQAGKNAGCKTILIGKEKCELCRRMEQENARPDFICENLLQAASVIKNNNIP